MEPATIAARVILNDPRARRAIGWIAALAGLILTLPLVVLIAILCTAGGGSTGTVGTAGGIPAVYAPMYQAAAGAYGVNPYVLLHETESDYSRGPAAFTANSAGAIGPMQFLPATWHAYASAYRPIAGLRPASYPHSCPHHGCITDDFDAIAAAAEYLHQLGADSALDQHTLDALIRYKGTPPASIPYARQAFDLAQSLQAANAGNGGPPTQAAGPLLERLLTVAGEIAAAHIPYCYGGGHLTPARPSPGSDCRSAGLDCSSAVSMLLQHAGIDTPTLDSSGFMSFAQPGAGSRFTIWADPEHVFVTIDGRGWGTSDSNPDGGPGWAQHTTVGFTPRHLPGL